MLNFPSDSSLGRESEGKKKRNSESNRGWRNVTKVLFFVVVVVLDRRLIQSVVLRVNYVCKRRDRGLRDVVPYFFFLLYFSQWAGRV